MENEYCAYPVMAHQQTKSHYIIQHQTSNFLWRASPAEEILFYSRNLMVAAHNYVDDENKTMKMSRIS